MTKISVVWKICKFVNFLTSLVQEHPSFNTSCLLWTETGFGNFCISRICSMRLRILRSVRAASLGGATSQLLAPTVFSLRSRLSTAAAVQVPTRFVDNIITAISISRWVTIGQKIYELWDDESVQNHQTVALHQALRKRSPDVITTICCKSLNNKTKNQYPYQNPSLPRNVSSYSFLAHSCPILIISDPKTKASIQMSSLMPVILSQNKQEWGLWIGFFVHWCLFNATRMSQYAQPCWRDVLVLFTLVELLSCALCVHLEEEHARNLVSGLPSEAQVRCLLSLSFTSTKPRLCFPRISSIWAAAPFSFFQILLILFHLWRKVGSLPVLEDPDQRLRVIRNWFSVSWFTSIGCPESLSVLSKLQLSMRTYTDTSSLEEGDFALWGYFDAVITYS